MRPCAVPIRKNSNSNNNNNNNNNNNINNNNNNNNNMYHYCDDIGIISINKEGIKSKLR